MQVLQRRLHPVDSGARIDLLVTDVGLPGGMNGRQVADAARVKRPEPSVRFITGDAENAVLNHGHLDRGALATRIRELMRPQSVG